ncbi:thermonuclease family protein [Candidatus Bathyarchaeota archaeon]|jgi:endonuclease YncB( thermonuclease family)|nr:thermonuclease family protein [Candidatus Bathyarchaeota archaeon]
MGENDMTTMVNWVIDGDTFNVTAGATIRLADIDAPEFGDTGYGAAKSLLISLAYNKTVYLDIDDISRTDQYGRLICVAYVDYNLTHVKNINKALLTEGVVIVNNYTNNEFNPSTWTLYVSRMVVLEFPNIMSLGIVMSALTFAICLFQRKRTRACFCV